MLVQSRQVDLNNLVQLTIPGVQSLKVVLQDVTQLVMFDQSGAQNEGDVWRGVEQEISHQKVHPLHITEDPLILEGQDLKQLFQLFPALLTFSEEEILRKCPVQILIDLHHLTRS